MDRVRSQRPLAAREPVPSWWERLKDLLQRSAPAWGLVSLALILALGVSNLRLRQQVEQAQLEADVMRIVRLQGTDAAPQATGTLVLSVDGEHGTLVVDGLPPLDEAHQYQLWLIKDGHRTSGGLLSVNSEGYGALWVSAPEPLASYPSFGITLEPAGGSPGPTGAKVLGGSL
jgi:anti-sigma-K factor RskA